MAGEEPKVGLHLEHGAHQALAVFAARLRDLGDAVEHQHRRQRQLRAFREQLAAPAGEQVFVLEARTPLLHPPSPPPPGRAIP